MKKFFEKIAYLTLFLAFILVCFLSFWVLYPYKPIEFKNDKFKVNVCEVTRGSYVTYFVSYCKNSDVTPVVTRTFVDGIIYTMPQDPQPCLKKGCHDVKFFIYVPKALPEGTYSIKSTYSFKVNPIRKIDIYGETVEFEVI